MHVVVPSQAVGNGEAAGELNHEGESTDAMLRGGLSRTSEEAE